jgi:hypothetical protein
MFLTGGPWRGPEWSKVIKVKSCTIHTECVTDLDKQSKMIIFGSILSTFKWNSIFGGSWGSIENRCKTKTEPPSGNLACPNR